VAVAINRDTESLSRALVPWLSQLHPDWSELSLEVDRPQPGMSSETLFVDVSHDGRTDSLVVRLPSSGGGLFPDYDLAAQARVQNALAAAGLKVPPAIYEPSDEVLGAPFVVMDRVSGRTLTTQPHFVRKGWLKESTDEQQATLESAFIDVMATINRIDPSSLELGRLSGGGPSLESSLAYWQDFCAWATTPELSAPYRAAFTWLAENLPSEVPAPSLLWGDPQLVNLVIGDDYKPVAVLDWEMSTTGPAEIDLMWVVGLHTMSVGMVGGVDLPGFSSREAFIERYAEQLGRPLTDLNWYEVYAVARSGALLTRSAQLAADAGADTSWVAKAPQIATLAAMMT
jgi:aminoglycoside phosphotransferase (APT) family kinase protein